MKKYILFLILLMVFSTIAMAQETKKVGVLPTVNRKGNVNEGVCLILQSQLAYAVTQKSGYEGYDRVDMGKIIDELDFQRTGLVSDEQIKELGKLNGVDYLLIAEVANYDINHVVITAKILNAETARLESTVPGEIASTNPKEMRESCMNVANMLLGEPVETTTKTGVLTKWGDLYRLDNQPITNERYLEIINNCPEAWAEHEKGCKQKRTGIVLLGTGIGITVASGIVAFAKPDLGLGMAVAAGVGVGLSLTSIRFFKLGNKKINNAYNIYNQYCAQQSSASLSFGPTGNGIGVCLNF